MPEISFRFLDNDAVRRLQPPTETLLALVEGGLRAHGEGRVVLPPKAHLFLPERYAGHFNILPGFIEGEDRAGVKVVGDFLENWRRDLPSEIALRTLYDPATGAPIGLMDACRFTWLRTGAVTGVG